MLEQTTDREEIIERVAALDIGKAELVCCVRVPGAEGKSRRVQEVTTYQTMTRALLGMVDRLTELGVARVVMEATSDYWKPPVRHEALWNRVEVRRLRRWPVAAGQ
jgi:transposase